MSTNIMQELPLVLASEIESALIPGETIELSLSGSVGEAVVVTNHRAMIVREHDSGGSSGCDLFAYRLREMNGASVKSEGGGNFLELGVSPPPAGPEEVRVHFPSYDCDKFQAAADALNVLIKNALQPACGQASVLGESANGHKCASCGSGISELAIYCRKCGVEARRTCAECGAHSLVDSVYCERCGRRFEPRASECPECGTRTLERTNVFCTECGARVGISCAGCGSGVSALWKQCAYCGRRLASSDKLEARASQMAFRRSRHSEEEASAADASKGEVAEETTPYPAAMDSATPVAQNTTAADHNKKGQELYEAGDVEPAIREFKSAVGLEPNNASFHCNLAIAYDDAEQDELALIEYETTLGLDPNDTTALLSLGYMYNENEEYDKAQAMFARVLDADPNSPEADEARVSLRSQGNL